MKRLLSLATIALATFASVTIIFAAKQPPAPPELQYFDCGKSGAACEVGGRHYNFVAPKGDGPFPLVVFFHGSRQSGDKTLRREWLVNAFIRRGYALAAPTALDIIYRRGPGTGWLNHGSEGDRDDHQFVINMMNDLRRRFPIDDQKILVTGSSNGAIFSWYLACANIDPRLKFFAPHGGTPVIRNNPPKGCEKSDLEFHLMHAHGQKDTVIPPEGLLPTDEMVGYRGVEESVAELAFNAQCRRVNQNDIAAYSAQIWWDCANGHEYGYTIHNGGHGTPHGWPDFVIDWYEIYNPK